MGQDYEVLLGGGCFWGVQRDLEALPGIRLTETGYAGGHLPYPRYEQVCSDTTGHAEVVRVVADGTKLSFQDLLRSFFRLHDPTQGWRQGPDVGSQYRSIIIVPSEAMAAEAKLALEAAQRQRSGPITTEVVVGMPFYRAEERHQHYYGACDL